jgi:hypothetical protein
VKAPKCPGAHPAHDESRRQSSCLSGVKRADHLIGELDELHRIRALSVQSLATVRVPYAGNIESERRDAVRRPASGSLNRDAADADTTVGAGVEEDGADRGGGRTDRLAEHAREPVPGVLELKRRLAHGGITRRQFDRVPAAHVPRCPRVLGQIEDRPTDAVGQVVSAEVADLSFAQVVQELVCRAGGIGAHNDRCVLDDIPGPRSGLPPLCESVRPRQHVCWLFGVRSSSPRGVPSRSLPLKPEDLKRYYK